MKSQTSSRILLIAGLVLGAALLRLVPHPPNFTPIGAIALFAGAHLGRRWLSLAIPLAAMLVSDALLEVTTGWGFHEGMPVIYGAIALIVALGLGLARIGIRPLTVVAGAIGSATLFFLVTNFFVWLSSGMYPPSLAGLVSCYVAAIPFYGNTLGGDLLFASLLFGAFSLAERKLPVFAPAVGG
ncbi:MAG TPA: DUF6580 family putative transport protein [Thermoanaerobaculia bacterium]|nr:DUF6580 family putative transport protein [Thermoanaerobaculia bacterium]